ncbi:MAG: tryptophan-rich sensory protein [SAR202 cluster bacterium]|nr:tryptophan-rich sensory protein [SAR202 cluster bacterium]
MSVLALAGFLGGTGIAAAFGAAAGGGAQGDWYRSLRKPPFNPPGWVFGPVWSVLYVPMAVSAWRVWHKQPREERAQGLRRWALQLALNAAWSPLFFRLRATRLALADIAVLWAAIALYANKARAVDRTAALLMVPYLLWVSFASLLNEEVVRRNRPSAGAA